MKFNLGQIVSTPACIDFMVEHAVNGVALLERHKQGDWGDMDADDKQRNDDAIQYGGRLFSSYNVGMDKIWIITESDRSVTTLLLPDDY